MHPFLAILIVLSSLGLLLTGSAFGVKRGKIGGESARKVVHLGMGMICLTFPWLFRTILPVNMLGLAAALGIYVVRGSRLRATLGSALFSVSRLSLGELLFPLAVAWLFTLYKLNNDPVVYYLIPLLLLTLADTAGALAGTRFGKKIYVTSAGVKSVEGSLAFFATSFACIFAGLCFQGSHTVPQIISIALALGIFMTVVEGIAGLGVDNLLIPIGSYFLLSYYADLSFQDLWIRVVFHCFILLLFIITRRKHDLNGGAMLSASLLCFVAFIMGGVYCLAAGLLILLRHIIAINSIPKESRHRHSIEVILAVSTPAIVWLTLGKSSLLDRETGNIFFIASLALTVSMLHIGTRKFLHESALTLGRLWTSAGLALVLLLLTYPIVQNPTFIAMVLVFSPITSILYHRVRSDEPSELIDWIILCLITAASTVILYFIYAYYF